VFECEKFIPFVGEGKECMEHFLVHDKMFFTDENDVGPEGSTTKGATKL
jgi:hypothetical protein